MLFVGHSLCVRIVLHMMIKTVQYINSENLVIIHFFVRFQVGSPWMRTYNQKKTSTNKSQL